MSLNLQFYGTWYPKFWKSQGNPRNVLMQMTQKKSILKVLINKLASTFDIDYVSFLTDCYCTVGKNSAEIHVISHEQRFSVLPFFLEQKLTFNHNVQHAEVNTWTTKHWWTKCKTKNRNLNNPCPGECWNQDVSFKLRKFKRTMIHWQMDTWTDRLTNMKMDGNCQLIYLNY